MGYHPSGGIRETLTIPCDRSAWTDESNPSVNHGSDLLLQNGGSNTSSGRNALFHFDLSSVPYGVGIVRARLRLFCDNESVNKGGTYSLRGLLVDWTESGVNHLSSGIAAWSGGNINAPGNYDAAPILVTVDQSHVDGAEIGRASCRERV